MQFGSNFQRLLRKIFQSEPKFGLVFLTKGDTSGGFYQGWLRAQGLARLGMIVPLDTRYGEPLTAFPLLVPMG